MRIGLYLLAYALEVVKYSILYKVIFYKYIWKWGWFLTGACGLAGFCCFGMGKLDMVDMQMLMYLTCILVSVMAMQDGWGKRLLNIAMLIFLTDSLDVVAGFPVEAIWKETATDIQEQLQAVAGSFVSIILLIAVLYLQRLLQHKKVGRKIPAQKIFLGVVLLVAMEMQLTVEVLDSLMKYMDNYRVYGWTVFLCTACSMGIGLLGILAIYIVHTNEKLNQMVQTQKLLNEMQEHYYKELLEREENTRHYRHDMQNHLICLARYAGEGNQEALLGYLDQMGQIVNPVRNRLYQTGSDVLDSVTNYYLEQVPDGVEVKVGGRFSDDLNGTDLCIAYANLLKNAVEELKRQEQAESLFLTIEFAQGGQYAKISICNSMRPEKNGLARERLLRTEKQDAKNHGLGIRNVEEAVRRLGGELTIKTGENMFQADILFRL